MVGIGHKFSIVVSNAIFAAFRKLPMKPLQMVDLKQQYHRIKPEVDAAISGVLESSQFIGGPSVQNFSRALAGYLGAKHVVTCANGTDALQIALMALDLEPGDEVITPSFTYIATTEVVALLGLQPVFVDVDPKTFCIDPVKIKQAITPRTRVIVPVHLYGQCANMEEIMAIARDHALAVIEDTAQAIGADYFFINGTVKKAGTIGAIGCTSFFPSKNLGCYGDGGAMFTDDDELAEKLKMIANHGQQKRYYHELVGCNSRLDALQAAILNIKLPLLDGYINARRKVANFYDKAFGSHSEIQTPFRAAYCNHVFHQYTLILDNVNDVRKYRDDLVEYLSRHDVPSMIYYPVPAHRQQMFASFGGDSFDLEKTDWLTERVVSLPMHTEMEDDQLEFVTQKVLEYINR